MSEGSPATPPARVALFATCMSELAAPGTALATADVLRAIGVAVGFPDRQTCCGQPALTAGAPRAARRLARHWIEVFADWPAVVTPSGSCAAMVRHHYPRLLRGPWAERAAAVASRTWELTQFVDAYGAGLSLRLPGTATWHTSCHMLRGLGERTAPARVLERVAELRGVPLRDAETCCGFGGIFATRFPEVSVAMADDKLAAAGEAGADWLVSGDPGCLLHLAGRAAATGSRVRTRHVAELLRDALPPVSGAGPGRDATGRSAQ